ncbi:MAG: MBL fold metallo-hydrolase [Nitrospiraceae bacterium]|nr:MBL fold metallo-hydrolase [Nitrospiraceae bacterium]
MDKIILSLFLFTFALTTTAVAHDLEKDTFKTSSGDLTITFIGHGSILFEFKGKNIYVDPFSRLSDYALLPKADLILITHEHRDHLDPAAIEKIRAAKTQIILTEIGAKQLGSGTVMRNGDKKTVEGLEIEAVPAYNLVHKRETGEPFHPRGNGNGYIIVFGDKRVYVAGDTENIPEMKTFKNIDIAFLPMNLPYTMTPEMTAEAAKMVMPKVLYPYHYGETDPAKLVELLKDQKGIEVRIRKMP